MNIDPDIYVETDSIDVYFSSIGKQLYWIIFNPRFHLLSPFPLHSTNLFIIWHTGGVIYYESIW